MLVKDIIKMNSIIILDISSLNRDDLYGNEWAIIHLDNNDYIKGLHFKAANDNEFDYLSYIPESEVMDEDIIYHGYVDEHLFYANEIKFKGNRYNQ